jgi:hypothetical protein
MRIYTHVTATPPFAKCVDAQERQGNVGVAQRRTTAEKIVRQKIGRLINGLVEHPSS